MNTREEKIKEVLTRSVENIVPSREAFEKALLSDKKLKIYIGADATGAHLHLGHLTNFIWLKKMQALGHEIIFLVGDFTARIGDPTDKMKPRQQLNAEQVRENERTFKKQVSNLISFSGKNPAQIRFNSEWYEKMTLQEFIWDSIGYFSTQNLLHRPGFKERIERDTLQLKEFLYPLFQAYDGVAMNVDVELGGNDQTFNMGIGRALRAAHSKTGKTSKGEKFFVATALLVNPKTGKKLMNKSEDGLINLDDSPQDIFGKVMALDDDSMLNVAEHCTELPLKHIEELKSGIVASRINPRDAKFEIAAAVVETIYGEGEAKKAQSNWESVFSKKETPADAPALLVKNKKISALELVVLSEAVSSKSEARRLIAQGGLKVNGETKKNPAEVLNLKGGEVLKLGKRRFFRVR